MKRTNGLCVLLILALACFPVTIFAKLDIGIYNEGVAKFAEVSNPNNGEQDWMLATWSDNPKLYFELKLSGTIVDKLLYFWSKWGGDNVSKDEINLAAWEAHLQLKFNKNFLGGSGELILFQNEGRWNLGNPIYKDLITSPSDGNNNQIGFWLDTYDVITLNELKGFMAICDPRLMSTKSNDISSRHTAFALRARKDLLNSKLKIGAMQHLDWWYSNTGDTDDNIYSMTSLDIQMTLIPNMYLGTEWAYTYRPFETDNPETKKSFASKTVLSYGLDLKAFGKLYFYTYMAFAGVDFDLSGRGNTVFPDLKKPQGGNDANINNYDRYVEFFELTYNFPLKAIYLKSNLTYSHKISGWDSGAFHLWNMKRTIGGVHISEIDKSAFISNFNELSVEFINGFYFKSYFTTYTGRSLYKGVVGSWKNLIMELSVENKLARIKPQVAFYNMGDDIYGAVAFGGELLLNITKNFKLYTRFAIMSGLSDYAGAYVSSEGYQSWGAFYMELQYFGLSNAELYLRFGDGGKNEHLAQTYNLIAGYSVNNVVEFQIKFWL